MRARRALIAFLALLTVATLYAQQADPTIDWIRSHVIPLKTPEAGNGFEIDLTGYFQQMQVTDLRSTFTTDLRRPDLLESRPGRAYGVELLLRRRATERLYGWIAYTLARSERAIDGVWGPSDWDQRHILNLVATYRLRGGYSIGGRFHYHTGRPYPVQDASTGTIDYLRLPAFYQLDLRADKRMVFDRFALTAYVELGNATLNQEVTGLSTTEDASGRPTYDGKVRDLGFRLILPSIGVHAEF